MENEAVANISSHLMGTASATPPPSVERVDVRLKGRPLLGQATDGFPAPDTLATGVSSPRSSARRRWGCGVPFGKGGGGVPLRSRLLVCAFHRYLCCYILPFYKVSLPVETKHTK